MSKFTPEVGDVLVDEDMNIKIRIIGINKYNGSFECILYDMDNNFIYTKVFYFLTDCKYLGKSKANVEELFDVAED